MQKFLAFLVLPPAEFRKLRRDGRSGARAQRFRRSLILHNTLYTILYCAIVLSVAAVIFSRKDLK